jgi:hypothetical protein
MADPTSTSSVGRPSTEKASAGAAAAAQLANTPIQSNPCTHISLSANNAPGVGNTTDPQDGDGDGQTYKR